MLIAHPHVFIENSFTFVLDSSGLSGIEVKWTFDEIFSSAIIMDFDFDGNNKLNDSEIVAIRDGAFSNLANFGYFLHIAYNDELININSVTDFHAEIINNQLVYYFFIPF